MMRSQKHLFQLPEDIHFLDCAYMSPLLYSSELAGIKGMQQKRNPFLIKPDDFFREAEEAKTKFGQLVHCENSQVAIIPSVSYGINSAVTNIPVNSGQHIIGVSSEFPSDFYTVEAWCRKNGKELKVIQSPASLTKRGEMWTESILAAINSETCAVVMPVIHWTDGTTFDLKKIGLRCKEANALLIVDGTQSVGAMPIDLTDCNIDALVCTSYKWLLGPYSMGLAYYSEFFNSGIPLEQSWMNRTNASDFTRLTDYTEHYKPGAARYNVGEYGNLILLPMLKRSLDQILEWQVNNIQDYCHELTQPLIQFLRENDYWLEENEYRSSHMFGFLLPKGMNREKLLQELQERKIIVSIRGDGVRVSPYLYNTADDIDALIYALSGN